MLLGQGVRSQKIKDSLDIYLERFDYLRAQKYGDQLVRAALKKQDYKKYADILVRYSQIYVLLNDAESAQRILRDGLEKVEQKKNLEAMVLLINRIGGIYVHFKNHKLSTRYFHRAWKLSQKSNNRALINKCEQSLFRNYIVSKKWDSASYFLKSIDRYARGTGEVCEIQVAINNAFAYNYTSKNVDALLPILDSLLLYSERCGDKARIMTALVNRAAYYFTFKKDFRKAKVIYDRLFKMAPGDTISNSISDAYYTYADIMKQLGHNEESIRYLEKTIEINEMNYEKDRNRLMWEMEGKYQLRKLSDKFTEEKKQQQQVNDRRNKIALIVIFLLAICLILLYFYMQNNRLKQKNRLQEVQVQSQQQILGATLDARESERHKIASVLHDNISALLGSAGMQLMAFASRQPENAESVSKAREILATAHDSVRELSHELVPVFLSRFGLSYAITDCCERFETDKLKISHELDAEMENRFDPEFETKIFFVLSELINNAVKHAQATKIHIKAGINSGLMTFSISDNGKGFDTNQVAEGFGLTQIRARLFTMGGKLTLTSKPGSGTTVSGSVPVVSMPVA